MLRLVPRAPLVGAERVASSSILAIACPCSALCLITDRVIFWRARAASAAIDAGNSIVSNPSNS